MVLNLCKFKNDNINVWLYHNVILLRDMSVFYIWFKKNVLISIKITFPFWAIRYFSSFFMTNIIRFLQATRDFLKIHICDQTNFLSATLNGWNIVIHTTLLMVLLYKYYIKNIPNLQILKYTFTLAHISSRLWYYPPIIYCLPD